MCDTLYSSALAAGGKAGNAYFAKNSDRHPSEPQTACIIPERTPSPVTTVGKRTFEVADKGFAFFLSKPSWMSGGEMGINSRGVAIGNEAVFSKIKVADDGVLGMDILRAALASSATAKEALDFICCFTEKNDQGGNGAYKGKLVYSNSYLIVDPEGAFILETAGKRWAWRQANVVDSISNTYTIEEDYKRLDTQTRKEISPVNERAACSDEADPGRKGVKESWKAHFENRFYLLFSKGEQRRAGSLGALEAARGKLDLQKVFGILRSHLNYDPAHPLRRHMESLCIHRGFGPANSATTASMAVEYRADGSAMIWFAGTSYPCVSLYKPVLLSGGTFAPLWTDYDYTEGAAGSVEYWNRQKERIGKRAGQNTAEGFAAKRDGFQKKIQETVAGLGTGSVFGAGWTDNGGAGVAVGKSEIAESIKAARTAVGSIVKDWEIFIG